MKRDTIIFWITTGLIFITEGVMPALMGNTAAAKEGISHLGFPDYFRIELNISKILGSLAILLPMVPARVKEWAYFGLALTMISAFIAHWAVEGLNGKAFAPFIALAILAVSYVFYHKINKQKI